MKYSPEVDGLRAIAVMLVVAFHVAPQFCPAGFVGVDVFFVISGYLISSKIRSSFENGDFSLRAFYDRRARRILPALATVLLAVGLTGFAWLSPAELTRLGHDLVSNLLFIPNITYWRTTGYFDVEAERLPLLHTWSLGVEEQFYVFFPLLFVGLLRWRRRSIRPLLLVAIGVSAALMVAGVASGHPSAAFYLLPTRAWELLAGALLSTAPNREGSSQLPAEFLGVLGLASIIAGAQAGSPDHPWQLAFPLLAVAGAFLIVHASKTGSVRLLAPLRWPVSQWLGLRSYSIYLWHWPLLIFAQMWVVPFTASAAIGVVVGTLALSELSWRLVEQPFRNRRRVNAPRAYAIVGTVWGGLATLAATTIATSGVPNRFPRDAQRFFSAKWEWPPSQAGCVNIALSTSEPGMLCPFGRNRPENEALVWGDSHAFVLRPMLDSVAQTRRTGGIVATLSGCAPLPGLSSRIAGCRAFNDSVWSRIASGGVRHVVLVARWQSSTEGVRKGYGFGERRSPVLLDRNGSPASPAESKLLVSTALRQIVLRLHQRGIAVSIMYDVPDHGYDVPSYLGRNSAFGLSTPTLATPRSKVDLDGNSVREAAKSLINAAVLTPIDPIPDLCDQRSCATAESGEALYSDSNHLTRRGTAKIAYHFAQLLSERDTARTR